MMMMMRAGGWCAFLTRPGQQDIQTDLFYDYRTDVASYPAWQDWLRQHQPPLLVTSLAIMTGKPLRPGSGR
jgi:hypothetical protein